MSRRTTSFDAATGDLDAGTGSFDANADGFDVDLHAHTRFFHGWPGEPTSFDPVGARLLGRFGRYRDLDGIAFTNHDYYHRYGAGGDTSVLPGIEISTTAGHVLVVGPDPPRRTEPDALTPTEAVELAHERDCAAILPHPFRRGELWRSGAPFDAVEVNGKRPQVANRVKLLAGDMDLPVVGGSDAHYPFEVGRVYTHVEAETLTPAAVVDAIREGRVEPRISETRLHRLLRRGYRYVHEWKGHVASDSDPEPSPKRIATQVAKRYEARTDDGRDLPPEDDATGGPDREDGDH